MSETNGQPRELVRALNFKNTVGLLLGSVIGTGVFLKAAGMAELAHSAGWVLVAWFVAGLLSLAGALCYAELGSRFPEAGGEYSFLRHGYGEGMAFLYGWSRFWVASPGSMAAYAVGSVSFVAGPMGWDTDYKRAAVAIALIIVFSLLNMAAVAFTGFINLILTTLKMVLVIGLAIVICTFSKNGSLANMAVNDSSAMIPWLGPFPGWPAFGTMLISCLWAYDGWNSMAMVAGEIRDPKKNIPLAFISGMLIAMLLYCFINFSYFFALPLDQVMSAYSDVHPNAVPVAAVAVAAALSATVAGWLVYAFAVSGIGALHGAVLAFARVPYAMAQDGIFWSPLKKLNSQAVPVRAVWAQAGLAILLAMSGAFDELSNSVVVTEWVFYSLAIFSLWKWRRDTQIQSKDIYTVPLFPLIPIIFITAAFLLVGNALFTMTRASLLGIGFTLLGWPVYRWIKKANSK